MPQNDYFAVSDNSRVSRRHASIEWNGERGEWELRVHHKLGMSVNLEHCGKGAVVPLTGRAAIRVCDSKLYFLPPV